MSKQRHRPEAGTAGREAVERPMDFTVDPQLAEHMQLGNAAAQAQVTAGELGFDAAWMGAVEEVGDGGFARAVAAAADDAVHALLDRPADPDQHARWVAIIVGSALPAAQKAAVLDRLTQRQEAAIASEAACARWLGPLDDAARSAWVAVFDRARDGESSGGDPAEALAARCVASGAAALHAEPLTAVRGFVDAVRLRRALDDDEEDLGSDYVSEAEGR